VTPFVKSSVPSAQLVLVMLPAPEESMVVVPAALQFHVGEDENDHCVESTLTDGGTTPPATSHAFAAFPSQSNVPPAHDAQEPLEHVWDVVHTAVVHDVPQLESRLTDFSHPCAPSHSRVPAGHATHAPPEHVWVIAVHGAAAPQAPAEEQVCTPLPEHCFVFGTQVPWQEPFTHAEAAQGESEPHVPVAEQVCTELPLH
jgi:hypothetical protein